MPYQRRNEEALLDHGGNVLVRNHHTEHSVQRGVAAALGHSLSAEIDQADDQAPYSRASTKERHVWHVSRVERRPLCSTIDGVAHLSL